MSWGPRDEGHQPGTETSFCSRILVSSSTAEVALRELDILIEEMEGVERDPLQDDVFRARDELRALVETRASLIEAVEGGA